MANASVKDGGAFQKGGASANSSQKDGGAMQKTPAPATAYFHAIIAKHQQRRARLKAKRM